MRKHIIVLILAVFAALHGIGNVCADTEPSHTIFWIANSKTVFGTTVEVTENRQYVEDLLGVLAMEHIIAGTSDIGYVVPLYSTQDWETLEVGDLSAAENALKGTELSRELKPKVFQTNEMKMDSLVDGMRKLLDFIADKKNVELVLISNEDIWCRDNNGVANAKVVSVLQELLNAETVVGVTCYSLPEMHETNPLVEELPKRSKNEEQTIEEAASIVYVHNSLEEKLQLLYPTELLDDGVSSVLIENQRQLTLGMRSSRRMKEMPQVYYCTQEEWDSQKTDAGVAMNEQENVALIAVDNRTCIAIVLDPAPGVYWLMAKDGAEEYVVANQYLEITGQEIQLKEKESAADNIFWRNESVEICAEWNDENERVNPEDFLCTAIIQGEVTEEIALEYDPEHGSWCGEFIPEQAGEYTVKASWQHKEADWTSEDAASVVFGVQNAAPVVNTDQELLYQVLCVGAEEEPIFVQKISLEGIFVDAENDAMTYRVFMQAPEEEDDTESDQEQLEADVESKEVDAEPVATEQNSDAEPEAESSPFVPEDEMRFESEVEGSSVEQYDAESKPAEASAEDAKADVVYASIENDELTTYCRETGSYKLWVVAMDENGARSLPVEVAIECTVMPQIRVQMDEMSETFFRNQAGWISFLVVPEDVEALRAAGLWDDVCERLQMGLSYHAEDSSYGNVYALTAEDSILFDNINISAQQNEKNAFEVYALCDAEESDCICFLGRNGQTLEKVNNRTVFYFEAMNSIPVFNGLEQDLFELKLNAPFKDGADEKTIQIDLTGVFADDTDQMLTLKIHANESGIRCIYTGGEQRNEYLLGDVSQAVQGIYVLSQSAAMELSFDRGGTYEIVLDVEDAAGGTLMEPVSIHVRVVDLYERSMKLLVGCVAAFVVLITAVVTIICLTKPKYRNIRLYISCHEADEYETKITLEPLKSKGITLQQLLAWSQYYPDAALERKVLEKVIIKPSRNKRNMVRVKSLNVGIVDVYRDDDQIILKQGNRIGVRIRIQT